MRRAHLPLRVVRPHSVRISVRSSPHTQESATAPSSDERWVMLCAAKAIKRHISRDVLASGSMAMVADTNTLDLCRLLKLRVPALRAVAATPSGNVSRARLPENVLHVAGTYASLEDFCTGSVVLDYHAVDDWHEGKQIVWNRMISNTYAPHGALLVVTASTAASEAASVRELAQQIQHDISVLGSHSLHAILCLPFRYWAGFYPPSEDGYYFHARQGDGDGDVSVTLFFLLVNAEPAAHL